MAPGAQPRAWGRRAAALRYHEPPRAGPFEPRPPAPSLRHEHRHRKPRARPAAPRPAASRPATASGSTSRSSRARAGAPRSSRAWSSSARATARARPSPCASSPSASAWSARSRCTRRRSSGSRSPPAVTSAARSSTTCASASASAPASASAATPAPRSPSSRACCTIPSPRSRPRRPPTERSTPRATAEEVVDAGGAVDDRPGRGAVAEAAEAGRRRGRGRREPSATAGRRGGEAEPADAEAAPSRRAAAEAEPDAAAEPRRGDADAPRARDAPTPTAVSRPPRPSPPLTTRPSGHEAEVGRRARSSSSSSSSPSRSGLALGIQAFLVKPYRIPSESMVPTLQVGQRVLVNRIGNHFGDPHVGEIVVFHPPDGAETATPAATANRRQGQACDQPTPDRAERELHQARRRPSRATRSTIRGGHVYPQRQAREGRLHRGTCERRRRPRLQLPDADHASRRPLVHDGRQPWRVRRQPLLGPGPARAGSSAAPSPPTGRPAHRPPLALALGPGATRAAVAAGQRRCRPSDDHAVEPAPRRRSRIAPDGPGPPQRPPAAARAASAARAGACSSSTAASASAGSPAPTRPAAAASPARSSPPPCSSTSRRLGVARGPRARARSTTPSSTTPEAREALYPIVLRTAAKVAVVSRCVRGIDARGLHKTNLAALRDALARRRRAPGCLCLVRRLPGPRLRPRAARRSSTATRRSAAIAAASIVAKVTRDRFMHRADALHPGWEFAAHVGYSTPEHREAIQRQGVSPLHRTVVPVDGVPAARALGRRRHQNAASRWSRRTSARARR